ncbi:MAG: hypothetical protein ABIW84_01165 [Ilumatobacteraceae bacterium]
MRTMPGNPTHGRITKQKGNDMAKRINMESGKLIGGMPPKTQEMLTVEGLQCQLVEMQQKGERIIMEATDEIQKRNACLQEGLRVIQECRRWITHQSEHDTPFRTDILNMIDKWAGAPKEDAT